MYAASGLVRCVTCNKTEGENFAFYNLPEGMGEAVQTIDTFKRQVMAKGALTLLGMTVSDKEKTELED